MSGDLLQALSVLADIRAAVGDPEGRLMQDELVVRCRELRARAEGVLGGIDAASMTPELKEKAILKAVWDLLKQHEVTYDGAICVAVRIIIACARGSDSKTEAFQYAKRLLERTSACETAEKPPQWTSETKEGE